MTANPATRAARRAVQALAALLLAWTFAVAGAAWAAAPPPAPAPVTVASLDRELAAVQQQIAAAKTDDQLTALRAKTTAIQNAADTLATTENGQLASVDHQLAQLGTAGGAESVRRQRRVLAAQRATLQNEVNEAKLLSVTAGQAFDAVAERRRSAFTAKLFQQSASPLSPEFWTSLADSLEPDFRRLSGTVVQAVMTAWRAPEPLAIILLGAALLVAAALMLPVRRFLERFGHRRAGGDSAARPFRRSAYALWMVCVDTALPGASATALHLAAKWGGLLSSKADAMAHALVTAVIWAAAVIAIGRVLVSAGDPGRRVLPIDQDTAKRVRTYPVLVALITAAGLLLTHLNTVIGASLAATVAANCVITLAYSAVAGMMLVAIGRGRTSLEEAENAAEAVQSSSWTLVSVGLTLAVLAALAAILAGYTNLGAVISEQIFWLSVLAAVTYLLLRFADDMISELFGPRGWAARALFSLFSLRPSVIAQIAVLLSAALQTLLLIGAITLALTPFGRSGETLLSNLAQVGRAVKVGSLTISPPALMAGLVSLAIGVAIVRYIQGWLDRRFLPVTEWDAGVRNSVSTGVGYLGIGVTVLWALATAGLGLQQIALVASALSVGIGFGLQNVVQNFVSGLILLVERPVKAGDWVNIGGQEGNVLNIRVRATEIETFDRSTLIVPNSDLITKTVQNKTLGNPYGRIQIQLSIGDATQAEQARDLIMGAFKEDMQVLSDPAPSVFIDSLNQGVVNFNCFAYVASPRDVYGARSRLYFDILRRITKAGILFPGGGTPTMMIEPGPGLRDLVAQHDKSLERGAPPPPKDDGASTPEAAPGA